MTTPPLCLEAATESELSAAAEAGNKEARRLLLERCRLLARIAARELTAALSRATHRKPVPDILALWQTKVLTIPEAANTIETR